MKAALYCRLSKEDSTDDSTGKLQESESIQNQKALLTRYAADRGWDVYGIYCDEDYSGADQNRPAFCRLLRDAEQGHFEVVLVKTQSRFTRDMALVEHIIHGQFLEWGIRFVAVVDHIDTAVKGNKKARQINGLINQWYLEDLSENIRAVLANKRRSGQYVGGVPLYGYQKAPDNKNRLVPDPDAAAVVQRIFALYLAGTGKQKIASLLNDEGIPNPTRYKQLRGIRCANTDRNIQGLWSAATVGRILHERIYTGDLVQGRRQKASYKSGRLLPLPPESWTVVENVHEALIGRADYEAAQRLLQERTKKGRRGTVHSLAGKVRCLSCGSTMTKVSSGSYTYLRCQRHAAAPLSCPNQAIRLDRLEEAVLERLTARFLAPLDAPTRKKLLNALSAPALREEPDKEADKLREACALRERALRQAYLDKAAGRIDDETFTSLREAFQEERAMLEQRLFRLSGSSAPSGGTDDHDRVLERLQPAKLTRALTALFVDYVAVGPPAPSTGQQTVEIHWQV